jgi:hypothetical protein
MQDGARGQRHLVATLGALSTLPLAEGERPVMTTARTPKPLGPATRFEVPPAGLLACELPLKFAEACRERRPRHSGTLLMAAS